MRNYEQIAEGSKMKGGTINDSTLLEKIIPYMTMPITKWVYDYAYRTRIDNSLLGVWTPYSKGISDKALYMSCYIPNILHHSKFIVCDWIKNFIIYRKFKYINLNCFKRKLKKKNYVNQTTLWSQLSQWFSSWS